MPATDATRIRAYMSKKDIGDLTYNTSSLGNATAIDYPRMWSIVTGEAVADIEEQTPIANALGVSVGDIFKD